mgnify:CR=1 FL=1
MSEVDERVVQMKFDNAQFEAGVQQTLQSLNKLNKSIDENTRVNNGKSLTALTSSVDNLKSSFINVENTVGRKFSALGTIGDQVLRRIADGAMVTTKKLLNMIDAPLQQIKNGGWSRAMNIDQAKFQLEGLGVSWKTMNKDLQYAVNQTAYGLDSAAKAAAQLSASGIKASDGIHLTAETVDECAQKFKGMHAEQLLANGDLDQMSIALRAISGVASMTNSSYDDIANVFTRVAGQGRVMATDLNSLAARGMNAAATLGQVLGKSESEVRKMVSKGQIDFDTFSKAMYDAFGDQAIKANATFSGALANMKAALSKIGAEVFQPFLAEVPSVFNAVRESINKLKSSLMPSIGFVNQIVKKIIEDITSIITSFKDSTIIPDTVQIIDNAFFGLAQIVAPIAEAFRDIFPAKSIADAESFSQKLVSITNGFVLTEEQIEKIKTVASGAFTILKGIGETIDTIVKGVVTVAMPATKAIGSLASSIADFAHKASLPGQPLGSLKVIFEKVAYAAKEFKNNLSDAFSKIGDLPGVKKLTDAVSEFKRVIVDPAISKAVKSFGKFAANLNIKVPNTDSFLSFIDKIASKLSDFVKKIVDAKKNIKSTTDEIGDSFSIFGVIKNTVCGAIDFIKEKIESISEAFKSLKPSLSIGDSALNGFKNGFVGVISSFANSGVTISTATNGITSVMEYIQTFFAKFTTWLAKIQMTIQQFGISIGGALSSIALGAGSLGLALQSYNKVDPSKLLKTAVAVGMLALSAVALASIPKDRIVSSIVGIAVAFGILTVAIQLLFRQLNGPTKVTNGKSALFNQISSIVDTFVNGTAYAEKIKAVGAMLLEFAGAIAILAGSVYALGQLSSEQLLGGLAAVCVLLAASYAITKRLIELASKVAGTKISNIVVAGTGMVVMASAIKSLASSVVTLSSAASDPVKIIVGLTTVIGLMTALTFAAKSLAKIKSGSAKIIAAGIGMIAIASAINILSSAVLSLGTLASKPEELITGLGSVVVLLTGVTIAAKGLASFSSGSLIVGATSILIIAEALKVLSGSVSKLGNMSFTGLAKGLLSIGAALSIFVGLSAVVGTFPQIILGLTSLSLTLVPLSIGITALVAPIAALGALPIQNLIKGIAGFTAALGALVLLGALAQASAVGLLTIGAAVLLIGTGALAAGAGVLMFASGLNVLNVAMATLAAMLPAQINSAIMSFTTLISGILTSIGSLGGAITAAITTIIASIVEAIVQNIMNITEGIARILDAILNLIVTYIPKIVNVVLTVIVSVVQAIASHAKDFVTAGLQLITGIINGFAAGVGDLVQAAWNAAIALINAMADGLNNNKQALEAAITNLINAVLDFLFGDGAAQFLESGIKMVGNIATGILDGAEEVYKAISDVITNALNAVGNCIKGFIDAGADIVGGFVSGLSSNSSKQKVAKAGAELGKSAENGTRKQTKTHSPSIVFKEIANDCASGLADVKDNCPKVEDAYASLGDSAITGTKKAIDKGKKYINDQISDLANSGPASAFMDKYGNSLGFFSEETTDAIDKETASTNKSTSATTANTSAKTANAKASSKASKATKQMTEEEKMLAKYTKYATQSMDTYMKTFGMAFSAANSTDLISNTKEAFGDLAEFIYKETLKNSDATEDATQKAEERAKAVMKAFNEAFEHVRDTAKSSLDMFSSFDKKFSEKITPKQMLANFESQEKGITQFYSNLGILGAKGLCTGFVKELMDEGPSAYAKVSGLLDATGEEIEKLNEKWNSKESIANKTAAIAMTSLMTSLEITKLRQVDKQREKSVDLANDALTTYKKHIKEAQDAGLDMEETLKMVQDQAADTGDTLAESGPTADLITSYNDLQKAMMDAGLSNDELQEAMMDDGGFKFTENAMLTLINRMTDLQTVIAKFQDTGTQINEVVKSQLSSSISYFDEWSAKYEMTGDQLMKNVQSQIEGIAKYNDNIQTIIAHGGGQIVSMFGDKITPEIANAMAQLGNSALQTLQQQLTYIQAAPVQAGAKAQEAWFQYGKVGGMGYQDALSELAQDQALLAQATNIGTNISQGTINGMTQTTAAVAAAGQQVGQSAVGGVATGAQTHSPSVATTEIGRYLDQGLINGVNELAQAVITACRSTGVRAVNGMQSGILMAKPALMSNNRSMIQQIISTFRTGLDSSIFAGIGQQICSGLVNGIMSGLSWVVEAAANVAKSAYEAACNALDVHSPSRKTFWLGQMFDAGFGNGVSDGASSLTNTVTNTMQDALQTAVDLMNSSGEMQPTIRPVVDLSDAQNGSRLLSSMFSNIGPMRVNAGIGQITTPTDRMNAAIAGMNSGNSVTNGDTVLNIYATPGQNTKELADIVIKRLNNEYARRKAAWT